eukprot:1359003-Amorphochlora_amoeboformis.AAC.1
MIASLRNTLVDLWAEALAGTDRRKSLVESPDRSPPVLNPKEHLQLLDEIREKARALGLGPTEFTIARTSPRINEYYKWVRSGFNGEMAFLERFG